MDREPPGSDANRDSLVASFVMQRSFRSPKRRGQMASEIEQRLTLLISSLLRLGIIVSGIVVLIGGVVFLSHHGGSIPSYEAFIGEPAHLTSLEGIFSSVSLSSGRGIIQLGILVLLATPVIRVAYAMAGFYSIRDWLYVGIAGIVLTTLVLSFANLSS